MEANRKASIEEIALAAKKLAKEIDPLVEEFCSATGMLPEIHVRVNQGGEGDDKVVVTASSSLTVTASSLV